MWVVLLVIAAVGGSILAENRTARSIRKRAIHWAIWITSPTWRGRRPSHVCCSGSLVQIQPPQP
jgi:hypothetical protein